MGGWDFKSHGRYVWKFKFIRIHMKIWWCCKWLSEKTRFWLKWLRPQDPLARGGTFLLGFPTSVVPRDEDELHDLRTVHGGNVYGTIEGFQGSRSTCSRAHLHPKPRKENSTYCGNMLKLLQHVCDSLWMFRVSRNQLQYQLTCAVVIALAQSRPRCNSPLPGRPTWTLPLHLAQRQLLATWAILTFHQKYGSGSKMIKISKLDTMWIGNQIIKEMLSLLVSSSHGPWALNVDPYPCAPTWNNWLFDAFVGGKHSSLSTGSSLPVPRALPSCFQGTGGNSAKWGSAEPWPAAPLRPKQTELFRHWVGITFNGPGARL